MTREEILEHEDMLRQMYVENKRALDEARRPILPLKDLRRAAVKREESTAQLDEQLAPLIRHYKEVREAGIRRILEYRRKYNYYNES